MSGAARGSSAKSSHTSSPRLLHRSPKGGRGGGGGGDGSPDGEAAAAGGGSNKQYLQVGAPSTNFKLPKPQVKLLKKTASVKQVRPKKHF